MESEDMIMDRKERRGDKMEYQKNKNIQITFTIKESLYSEFKALCKEEKNMPAAVLKEFVKRYVDERKQKVT